MAGAEKVASDLMESPRLRGGFDEGEVLVVPLQNAEGGFCRFFGSIWCFSKRSLAGPHVIGGVTMNHGQVAFPDLPVLEILSDFSSCATISCENKDSGSGLIQAMNDVNFFFNLITKNLHGDKVVGLRVV